MAAALLTMRIQDANGRIRAISGYASDSSNALVKWDESKVAVTGSADFYTAKQPCKILDICFTSDLATPTHVQCLVNGTPTGDILDVTSILASVVVRPTPVIGLAAGDRFQLMQIA